MLELYNGQSDRSKFFLNNITGVNRLFRFVSDLHTTHNDYTHESVYTYKIRGDIHVMIESLDLTRDRQREYMFLGNYIHGTEDEQLKDRITKFTKKKEDPMLESIISILQSYITRNNLLSQQILLEFDNVREYSRAYQEENDEIPEFEILIKSSEDVGRQVQQHEGTYHKPNEYVSENEVGLIYNHKYLILFLIP